MINMLSAELATSFQAVAFGIASMLPSILGALIFIILGWIFGVAAGRVVAHLIGALRLDDMLAKAGVSGVVAKAGYQLNTGAFIGWLVKSFFIVIFLMAAFDVLGLTQVNEFLRTVLGYIPQVLVAAVMLLIASIAADILGGLVTGATSAAGSRASHLVGAMVRWAIWVFAVLAALSQLGIAAQYMYTLFAGIVAMLALAGGLAFGLGGKDAAADFIKTVRHEVGGGHKA
jgi:hypothetical protein